MLQVTDNQIKITSGDTAKIEITIYTQESDLDNPDIPVEEQIYKLQDGDILKFVVLDINKEGMSNNLFDNMFNSQLNKNLNKPPVLIKEFTDNIIKLKTNDTKFLNDGVYTYGVVLKTKEGQINTIQQGEFIILKGFC